MYITLVSPESLSPDLRAVWDGASDGGKKFVQAMAHAPEHASRLFPYYTGVRFNTRLGPKLCELLRLTIAQTTRCPTCLEGRLPAAFDEGLTEQQVAELVAPTSASFTDRELAVMRYAFRFGADHFAITEDDYRALYEHFSEEEVVEIGMLCAQFLGFGRLVMTLGLENPTCPIPTSTRVATTTRAHRGLQ